MSDGGYFLIRRDEGQYVVTGAFASEEAQPPIAPHDRRFPSLAEAIDFANLEPAELGMRIHGSVMTRVPSRPWACDHANECPNDCQCPGNCYCRGKTCPPCD